MLAYLLIVCVSFYIVSATLIRLVGEYLFNQKANDELYAACAAPKEKYVIHGAEHAVSSHWFHEEYWNRVDQFVAEYFGDEAVKIKN